VDARKFVAEKADKAYRAEFKIHRDKRSNDANSYFWMLTNKLSAVIQRSPVLIYRDYIPDIGDNNEIVPVRADAVEKWIENWKTRGIGWVCDIIGESKINGYINVICYFGSSTYDSAQMSRLIDLVVQDCKLQGIETLPPEELERMVNSWQNQNGQGN